MFTRLPSGRTQAGLRQKLRCSPRPTSTSAESLTPAVERPTSTSSVPNFLCFFFSQPLLALAP